MMKLGAIEETVHQILQHTPDPIIRFRLLRDVIKAPPDSYILNIARQEMLSSRWVSELRNEQKEDGGWGRVHSAMKTRGKVATTKAAVERSIDIVDI